MTRPRLVLNVNDDAASRYLLSKVLQRGGYEVVEASGGEEALRAVRETRPDLVLLDVKLPDVNGHEVCRRLKADPKTATLLVIQISATYATSDRRAEGLDSGADAYLAQPVEPAELLATVRALLRTQHAEALGRRALERVRRMFDAIQEPLFVVGADGAIEDCNGPSAALLGGEAGGLRGRACTEALCDIVPPAALRELLRRARAGRHEIEVARGGHHFRVSGDPLAGEDGAFDGVVVIVSDVSERKRLEGELRARADQLGEAARHKDELIGMLAHELRNPLNAIGAASAVWAGSSGDAAEGERLRAIIDRQTRHLARLVDDLLEAARVDRGLLHLRRQAIDLGQAVRRAVQGSRTVFEARSQRVALSAPDRLLIVDGDELRLEQVLMNLLANASKFSSEGADVEVGLEEKRAGGRREAEIRVRDRGVGIPAGMLAKIFEPFVQVEPSLARSLGGLGIGLSMVKNFVELHGGTVSAHSEGPGRGSEFVVRLPLVEGAPEAATTPAGGGAPAQPLRVVVVEDNDDALELVQAWLAQMGHEVQGAGDGASGLELLSATKPDVAFVDIGLPVLDGYEIARRLRSDGGADIYLVALTGYGQPEDRARALAAGFDAHVVKPLSEAALRAALESGPLARRPEPGGGAA